MIDELPAAPDPANDSPAAFNQKAAAFVLAQKAMVPQINASLGAFSAAQAGGAYALSYVFDTVTTDADPGIGKLRLSSATQNAATSIAIDNSIVGGQDASALIASWGFSTSSTKGYLKLAKQGDLTKWITFRVTAVTANSGYYTLAVTPVQGSATSPFTNADALLAQFTPAGDAGVAANQAMQFLGSTTITSGVSVVNFLTLFTSAYDKYIIELTDITSTASDNLAMRIVNSAGTVVSTASYFGPATAGTTPSVANQFGIGSTTAAARTYTMEMRNTNSAAVNKSFGYRGFGGAAAALVTAEGYVTCAGMLPGFQLLFTAGSTFSGGKVVVYGIRNSA